MVTDVQARAIKDVRILADRVSLAEMQYLAEADSRFYNSSRQVIEKL